MSAQYVLAINLISVSLDKPFYLTASITTYRLFLTPEATLFLGHVVRE